MNQTLSHHALALLTDLFRYGRVSYHGWVRKSAHRSYTLSILWVGEGRFSTLRWLSWR